MSQEDMHGGFSSRIFFYSHRDFMALANVEGGKGTTVGKEKILTTFNVSPWTDFIFLYNDIRWNDI